MTDDGSDSDGETLDLFTEPADYYPPSPKPTTQSHTLLSGEVLTLRLVGHNPLWGHHLVSNRLKILLWPTLLLWNHAQTYLISLLILPKRKLKYFHILYCYFTAFPSFLYPIKQL